MTTEIVQYHGGCYCKAVRYTITPDGPPLLAAYCHCTRCQRLSGAPFIATVHLPPHVFSWSSSRPTTSPSAQSDTNASTTSISDITDVYTIIDVKHRYRCKLCGANIASWNEVKQKWSVWVGTFDRDNSGEDGEGSIVGWEWAKPTDHQFYGTRMLDINDDLEKWEGYANKSKRISE